MAVDPMSGVGGGGSGIGQAASDLLKEMQKAQTELQQTEKQSQVQPSVAFQQAMETQSQGVSNVNETTVTRAKPQAAADVLQQARAGLDLPSTKVGQTARVEESKVGKLIENLVNGQDKMNQIMHMALSGKQFSPTELLAMQAGVYRFSQELDLTSKVVEKATGGIKQTLSTQV